MGAFAMVHILILSERCVHEPVELPLQPASFAFEYFARRLNSFGKSNRLSTWYPKTHENDNYTDKIVSKYYKLKQARHISCLPHKGRVVQSNWQVLHLI